jgi:hypothetical protein
VEKSDWDTDSEEFEVEKPSVDGTKVVPPAKEQVNIATGNVNSSLGTTLGSTLTATLGTAPAPSKLAPLSKLPTMGPTDILSKPTPQALPLEPPSTTKNPELSTKNSNIGSDILDDVEDIDEEILVSHESEDEEFGKLLAKTTKDTAIPAPVSKPPSIFSQTQIPILSASSITNDAVSLSNTEERLYHCSTQKGRS